MGCYSSKSILSSCYSIVHTETIHTQYKVALKLPHGQSYIVFDGNGFIPESNVCEWVERQFAGKKFTSYINYNDEHEDKMCAVGGHCKGCIAWNDTEICWLIHSVPKFMVHFHGDGLVDVDKTTIHHSEEIYGQSFVFLSSIPIEQLVDILQQLSIMKPFIDKHASTTSLPELSHEVVLSVQVSSISLTNDSTIHHVAKSPKNHIDIFSEMIQPVFGGKWHCETWIRGHACPTSSLVIDNKHITFTPSNPYAESIHYKSSQDHSKYACNENDLVYIGDLNRMTSQYSRGGGGVIIQNAKLCLAIRKLME